MNFKEMTNEAIKEHLSSITKSLSEEGLTDEMLDSAEKDIDGANKELAERKARAEKKASAQAEATKAFNSIVVPQDSFTPNQNTNKQEASMDQKQYSTKSAEYRSAWLKNMGGDMFAPMNEAEKAAFTIVTSDTTNGYDSLVPVDTANRIIDLTKEKIALFNDLTVYNAASSYTVPVVKSITKGDATSVTEGQSNADGEVEVIEEIAVNPTDYAKDSTMSARFKLQSIDAFETWLVEHVVERIIRKINQDVWTKISTAATTASNVVAVTGALKDTDVRTVLGSIKGSGNIVVYCNRKTLYTDLVGVETTNGDKLFTESTMVDPVVKGVVYGCAVKVDEDVADGEIYFAIPGQIEANMFEAANILSEIDVKTRNTVYAGHAIFGCAVKREDAFGKITITASV